MEQPLIDLIETYQQPRRTRNALESYHDAQQALDMAMNLFIGGYLPLEQRSQAENLYWAICVKLQKLVQAMDDVPEELQSLDEIAVGHLLLQLLAVPVDARQLGDQAAVPDHADPPAERAADAATPCSATSPATRTARSISSSIAATSRRRCRCTPSTASRTTSACSWSAPTRRSSATCTTCSATPTPCTSASTTTTTVVLDAVIKGDTVREVLDYVEFDAERADRASCAPTSRPRSATAALDYEESGRLLRFYEDGLHGYTYLEEPPH